VRHFPAAEFERDFDFHVFAEESDGMHDFDAEVMGINPGAKLDFLDGGGVLVFAGFLFALGLFVAEFPEVHEAADGGIGVGRNLDEVHAVDAGHIQGFVKGKNTQLFVVLDDADFPGTNLAVDPDKRSGRRTWSERATQGTLVGCSMTIFFSINYCP
jgi:hypothetical protein